MRKLKNSSLGDKQQSLTRSLCS